MATPSHRENQTATHDRPISKTRCYFAKISSYAQGMALLAGGVATPMTGNSNLSEIARIWKGGCIIRAELLDPIRAAFKREPELENLLLAPAYHRRGQCTSGPGPHVVSTASRHRHPGSRATAHRSTMSIAYRTESLPANLTQGQRDYFGAHTYRRTRPRGNLSYRVGSNSSDGVGTKHAVCAETRVPSGRRDWVQQCTSLRTSNFTAP